MRLVNSKQMQEMDRYTIEKIGIPGIVLMENAARSWIEAVEPFLRGDCKIHVFCGSGNNGGDGYAIARNLANRGYNCLTVAVKPPKSADCKLNAEAWLHFGQTLSWDKFLESDLTIREDDIVIDAVLGTGIESEIRGDLIDAISIIDKLNGFKIAVDLPSGISATTGDLLGSAIKNDLTITFQKQKIGHHLYPGKLYSGQTISQNISIKEKYDPKEREYYLTTVESIGQWLPDRKPDSYKNQYGHLITWCGSPGKTGASLLASFAALKTGTGLVTAALPGGDSGAFLAKAPELMSCDQAELTADFLNSFNALVIGCGLGRDRDNWNQIETILGKSGLPIIFDADAFYGIRAWNKLDLPHCVLTPHPGEFAYLSGYPKPSSNRERIEQGLSFVEKYQTVLVLKGAPTIVFLPSGSVHINSTGNSGMSTAGSGDVLSGIIGGLLAQGLSADKAALLGVWLHGRAGDRYLESHAEECLTAMSLIEGLNEAIMDLKKGSGV